MERFIRKFVVLLVLSLCPVTVRTIHDDSQLIELLFEDFVYFSKFFQEPAMVMILLFIWTAFAIALSYAKHADQLDSSQRGVCVLEDNEPCDQHAYLLGVVTGWWPCAGTTAHVFCYLTGSKGKSAVHRLRDKSRAVFYAGAENWFLMTTPDSVGDVRSVVIWHDNHGKSPAWYLKELLIHDMHTDRTWYCVYEDWIGAGPDLEPLCVELPTLTEKELHRHRVPRFLYRAGRAMRDGCLLVGVVAHPRHSRFTRVQRLACVLCMLLSSMTASILFIRDYFEHPLSGFTQVNFLALVNSIKTALMVFPVNLLLVVMFRNIGPRFRSISNERKSQLELMARMLSSTSPECSTTQRSPGFSCVGSCCSRSSVETPPSRSEKHCSKELSSAKAGQARQVSFAEPSSRRSVPEQQSSGQSFSAQPSSGQTLSAQKSCRQSISAQTSPRQSMTSQLSTGQSVYAQPSSGQSLSTQSSYGQSLSVQPSSGQSSSIQPSSGQSSSTQPSSGQSSSTQPSSGQSSSAQPSSGQSSSAQPSSGQSLSAQPSCGQSFSAQPSSGQSLSAQPSSGQSSSTQPSSGQSPSVQPSSGQSLPAQPSSGQSSSAQSYLTQPSAVHHSTTQDSSTQPASSGKPPTNSIHARSSFEQPPERPAAPAPVTSKQSLVQESAAQAERGTRESYLSKLSRRQVERGLIFLDGVEHSERRTRRQQSTARPPRVVLLPKGSFGWAPPDQTQAQQANSKPKEAARSRASETYLAKLLRKKTDVIKENQRRELYDYLLTESFCQDLHTNPSSVSLPQSKKVRPQRKRRVLDEEKIRQLLYNMAWTKDEPDEEETSEKNIDLATEGTEGQNVPSETQPAAERKRKKTARSRSPFYKISAGHSVISCSATPQSPRSKRRELRVRVQTNQKVKSIEVISKHREAISSRRRKASLGARSGVASEDNHDLFHKTAAPCERFSEPQHDDVATPSEDGTSEIQVRYIDDSSSGGESISASYDETPPAQHQFSIERHPVTNTETSSKSTAGCSEESSKAEKNLSQNAIHVEETHSHAVHNSNQFQDTDTNNSCSLGNRTVREAAANLLEKLRTGDWMLPWWCRDVAWCTVGLICISCTLVSALAGLKLGDKWVYHWAYVATMSVFQQLCAEPLFLIILSAIAIFVSNKGRNVKWEFSLDLEDIASDFRPRRAKSKPTALYTPARFHYPESVHQGYAITRRLQEEDYALGVVGEVVSYLTFFIIVLMASTGQHSVHQYLTTVVVREMFVEGGFANASIAPQEVSRKEHVLPYVRDTFLPSMVAYHDRSTSARDIYSLGQARLKQTRCFKVTRPYTAVYRLFKRTYAAHPSCSMFNEDHTGFNGSWQHPLQNASANFPSHFSYMREGNSSHDSDRQDKTVSQRLPPLAMTASAVSPWVYQSAEELHDIVTWGQRGWYSGGGYAVDLPMHVEEAQQMVDNLLRARWLDEKSSSVSLKASFVNPNLELLISVKILFEFDSSVSIVITPDIMTTRVRWKSTKYRPCIAAMETLFTIYIFVYACNKVLAVYQAGLRKCLCNGWFMLELTITVTGIVVIVLEFVEFMQQRTLFHRLNNAGLGQCLLLTKIMTTKMARQIFIALLLALVVLNSFRVFRVNRHFVTLVETFRAADRSLLHWCFVVLVLLIAYASYAVLGFNPKLEGYRNLGESMATLVTFSVGLFMSDEYPGLTQYTAFVFTVFFMTLLYTMCFVTILLEAFTYTRMLVGAKYSKNSVLSYLKRKLRLVMGLRRSQFEERRTDRRRSHTVCRPHK